MLRKLKLIFVLFFEFVSILYLKKFKKKVLVYHYNKNNNVGDLLHIEILKHYTDVSPVTPSMYRFLSKHIKNYLIVGSIIENSTSQSVVIGAGTNDPLKLESKEYRDFGEVKAVRGELTKLIIEDKAEKQLDLVLGDPGLLMPRIYNPKHISKSHKFGLVLHYVDVGHKIKDVVESMGGRVISVNQNPREFIDEILSCEKIISSSMHGVILADAYRIKNKRLILSDNIVGADFKFRDYYSTTDEPDKVGCAVSKDVDREQVEEILKCVSISNFKYSLINLESLIKSIR